MVVKLLVIKNIKKIFRFTLPVKERLEYRILDPKISVKIVDNIDEAINHIKKYGTNHTECIISNDKT